MKRRPKKEAPPNGKLGGANRRNAPESNTESAQRKPSWRDFYAVHPAAKFFHGFSSDEQLEEWLVRKERE